MAPKKKTLGDPIPLYSDPTHAAEYQLLELPKEVAALIENAQAQAQADPRAGSRKRKQPDYHDDDHAGTGDGDHDAEPEEDEIVLTLNGRHSDDAVLCTRDATYNVRGVAVSNAMMICNLGYHPTLRTATPRVAEGSAAGNVRTRAAENAEQGLGLSLRATLNTTLELQHTSPRLDRLRELLGHTAYQGPRAEEKRKALPDEDPARRLYTIHQVRSALQASVEEAAVGLNEAHVTMIDGYARMVGLEYLAEEVLRLLLAHVEMNAFPADSVPRLVTHSTLEESGIPNSVAEAVLDRWFAKPNQDQDAAPDQRTISLLMPAIARTLGLHTLRNCAKSGTRIPLDTFLSAWQSALGANWSEEARLELLEGQYYLAPSPLLPPEPMLAVAGGTKIVRLSNADLSNVPATRFSQLFAARPQWPKEELLPYVNSLAPDAHQRDSLLLKFCRAHTVTLPPEPGSRVRGRPAPPGRKVVVYSSRLRM